MDKRLILNTIAICLIFLALGIIIFFVKGKGGSCLENPLIYGAIESKKTNNGHDLLCSCSLEGIVPSPIVTFNSTGLSSVSGRTEGSFKVDDINNYSGLFIQNLEKK